MFFPPPAVEKQEFLESMPHESHSDASVRKADVSFNAIAIFVALIGALLFVTLLPPLPGRYGPSYGTNVFIGALCGFALGAILTRLLFVFLSCFGAFRVPVRQGPIEDDSSFRS